MFFQHLINGLTLGAVYALLALGYSMVFGVLSFINFAHGDVAMVGGYFTWSLAVSMGFSMPVAIVGGILGGAILGVFIERIAYKPLRNSPRLAMVIISMGFAFVLETLVLIIWGTRSLSMPSFVENHSYTVGGAVVNSVQLWTLGISFVIMLLLTVLVNKTKIGAAIRAVSLDQSTCSLMGINVNATISLVFAIGSGLGALSGILMASYYSSIYSTMGSFIGTKGFAAVVLGGAGSMPGAMLGGILIGLIESFTGAIFNANVKEAAPFVVLILVLLFKPSGILGKDVTKE